MPFIPDNHPDTFSDWIESEEGLEDSFRPDPYRFESLTFYPVPEESDSTDDDSDSTGDDRNSADNDSDTSDDDRDSNDDSDSSDSVGMDDDMDDEREEDEDNENEIDEEVIICLLEREIVESVPVDLV